MLVKPWMITVGVVSLISLAGVTACSDSNKDVQTKHEFAQIESGDECHLCGMVITRFPGPKGELYEKVDGQSVARKFCSTRDLMAYYLQPENRANTDEIFVHDMAQAAWEKPGNEHLIDGRKAWYVIGSSRPGAMGPTLASFKKEADADHFIQLYGGKRVRFDELKLDSLQTMMSPAASMPMSGMGSSMKMSKGDEMPAHHSDAD